MVFGIVCVYFSTELKDSDISKELLLFRFVSGARFHRACVNGRANLSLFYCPSLISNFIFSSQVKKPQLYLDFQ